MTRVFALALTFIAALFTDFENFGVPVLQTLIVAVCAGLHLLERMAREKRPELQVLLANRTWGPLVEGAVLGAYTFDRYRQEKDEFFSNDADLTVFVHPDHDPISIFRHRQHWTYMIKRYLKDPDDNPIIDCLKRRNMDGKQSF